MPSRVGDAAIAKRKNTGLARSKASLSTPHHLRVGIAIGGRRTAVCIATHSVTNSFDAGIACGTPAYGARAQRGHVDRGWHIACRTGATDRIGPATGR